MKKKFLTLALSSFCIFSMVGCAGGSNNPSNSQSDSGSNQPSTTMKVTVTFYMNDGTNNVHETKEVDYGTKTTAPSTPKRDGFKFRGWYVEPDCLIKYNFTTLLKSNTSLYALWEEKVVNPDQGGGNEGGGDIGGGESEGGELGGVDVSTITTGAIITRGEVTTGFELSLNEGATGPDNLLGEYFVEGLNLKAGDKISFKFEGKMITTGIGEEGDENHPNNAINTATPEAPIFEIVKDAKANVYLKSWEGNGFSFWVTGNDVAPNPNPDSGDTGGGEETTSTTYTVTSLPDWLYNDNCVLFAWVWGDDNPGKWVATEGSGTSLSFTVDAKINGFNLVRCKAGSTTPNWDEKGEGDGRIYNKSQNAPFESGTTSYTMAEDKWSGYPEN